MIRIPLCLGLVAVVATLGGCKRSESTAGPLEVVNTPKLRRVVLQTDWFPQAEQGGFYQALARGFYREVGLEVEILPGGPGSGIKLKVAKGDADFGMNRSDDIFLAAAQGMPLVMVAATMQHDPQALMVHADSPVKSLKDLQGRTIMANVHMTWIPYLQRKLNIKFNLVPNSYNLATFLANPDAIQQCLVTNEPYFAQQNGRRVRVFSLAESGYDCYQVIFCRRELVNDAPDVVRAFVVASIRGWQDYLEADPSPADKLILERNAQMTPGQLKFSRSEMILRSLVHGDRTKGEDVGRLSLPRLMDEMQTLLELKILDGVLPISQVVTTKFLPARP